MPDLVAPSFIFACLDHPRLGCGWRALVVLQAGPRWVTLLDPASLRLARVDRAQIIDARTLDSSTPKHLARRLAARRRHYQALGVPVPSKAIRAAERRLRRLAAWTQA